MSGSEVERRQPSPDTIYVKQNQLFGLFTQYDHAQIRPMAMSSGLSATPFRVVPLKVIPLVVEGLPEGQVLVVPYGGFAPPMSLRIELHNLSSEQLERMECAMLYEGQLYVAKPNIESVREGKESTILSYGEWKDEKNERFSFQDMNDPEFLIKVRFLVRDKTQFIQGNPKF